MKGGIKLSKHKKKHHKTHDTINGKPLKKKDLAYYQENFHEVCDYCGAELVVTKHKPKTHSRGEVVSATCQNDNFKGLGVKCEQWCIEIRFRSVPWC